MRHYTYKNSQIRNNFVCTVIKFKIRKCYDTANMAICNPNPSKKI